MVSLPCATLCVLVGLGDWGQWGRGLACLKNAGIWGGSLRSPTGSNQSIHPCWKKIDVHNVP